MSITLSTPALNIQEEQNRLCFVILATLQQFLLSYVTMPSLGKKSAFTSPGDCAD